MILFKTEGEKPKLFYNLVFFGSVENAVFPELVFSILTSTIKMAKEELLPAITHIINLSVLSSTFPEQFKKAKVIHRRPPLVGHWTM